MANDYSQSFVNSQIKRTAKDFLIYLPAMVIPAIVGIILIRIFTSIFTPTEYGNYQLAFSAFGLIRVFSMAWLANCVTRFFLNQKNNGVQHIFFSTLGIASFVSAFGIATLSYLINIFFFKAKIADSLFSLVNLAIVASIFNTIFEIFVLVYRAGLEAKKYSLYWILFSVGKPLLSIGLILLFDLRVSAIFWGFLIVPLVLDIIVLFELNFIRQFRIQNFSMPLLREFANFGIPITFSMFSFWILSLSDRFLIEYFRGSSEVGLYAVGYVISERILTFAYTVLMLAAYPIIIENWEQHGDQKTQTLITELTRYYFLLCMPIVTVLLVVPKPMLKIFSSATFIDGAKVLPFIAIGVFFNGLCQYVLKGFELHRKSGSIAKLALIAGVINISLNLIFIPKYGYYGAGLSMLLTYLGYFILAIYFTKDELRWTPPIRSILNSILAACLLACFLLGSLEIIDSQLSFIFLILPSGIVLYYFSLFVIKEIKMEEVQKGKTVIFRLFRD
ncbi:MAG: polysaccharide biosynthesis C-terminal domain-containing protein [Candidatus Zhuqueibacterota bacterium]